MERRAGPSISAQLEAWRALKTSDASTLGYVSAGGKGPPRIELSKNAFAFADLKSRSTASDSFEVRNTGGGSLTGSIKSNKNWLQLAQTQLDASRKLQTISFSIDTTGLPFGATDTAAIEVQSNIGTESVSIAIAIEQGVRAAPVSGTP